MTDEWAQTPTDIVEDLLLMAERTRIVSNPGPHCPGVHGEVRQLEGRIFCLTCGASATATAEQMCDCLGDLSLVFERDGVYHAKPGPCADKSLSEAIPRADDIDLTKATSCDDCPFLERDDFFGEREGCNIQYGTLPKKGPPPDWCPLRKGPITIRLVTK